MKNTFDRLASLSRKINAQTHIDFNAMYDLKQKLWDLPNKVNSCQSEFEMLSGLAELEIGDSYFPKWQSRLIRSDDDYLKKMKINFKELELAEQYIKQYREWLHILDGEYSRLQEIVSKREV